MTDVFKMIVQFNIQAGIIVLAIIILRLLLKKAPRALICALWSLVAVRLLIPVKIESVFSLVPDTEVAARDIGSYTTQRITSAVWEYPETFLQTTDNTVIKEKTDILWNELPRIAAYIWIVGVIILLLYAFISYRRLYRLTRESIKTEDHYLCDRIRSPFILGIFRPRIILPFDINDADKPYILAHERAHLKRRDHLWKPLGFLLLSVYWFNPLLWVAYVLLCRDIELACDEKVITELGIEVKKPYANALINSAAQKRLITACPLAFGETSVKSRIKNVLNYKKPAFWVIVITIILSIIVAVCFLTNPVTKEKLMPDDLYAFASADIDGDGKMEWITLSPKSNSSEYSVEINAYDPDTYEKKYKSISAVNCWDVSFENDDQYSLIITGYNLMMNTVSNTDVYYRCALTVTDGQLGLSVVESNPVTFSKDADPLEKVEAFFNVNADKFPMNPNNRSNWTWADARDEYYGGTYMDGATQVILLTDISQAADYVSVGRNIRYEKCEYNLIELDTGISSINSALSTMDDTEGYRGSIVGLSLLEDRNKVEIGIYDMTDEKVKWFKENISDSDYLTFRSITELPNDDISGVTIDVDPSVSPEIIFTNGSTVYISGKDCGIIIYDIADGEFRGMLSAAYLRDLGYQSLYAKASADGSKVFLYDASDAVNGSDLCGVLDMTTGMISTSSDDCAENEEIFMFDTVQDGFKHYSMIPRKEKNGVTYTLSVLDGKLKNMELTTEKEDGTKKTFQIFG